MYAFLYPILPYVDCRLLNWVETQSWSNRLCNIGKRIVLQKINCCITMQLLDHPRPHSLVTVALLPRSHVLCNTDYSPLCVPDKGKMSWSNGCRPCRKVAGSWWCSWRDWWSCSRWPTPTLTYPLHPACPQFSFVATSLDFLSPVSTLVSLFILLQLWFCLKSTFQSLLSQSVSQ